MTREEIFASNLRCLREAYGETQEEMALALGISKNAISNYECGRRMPKPELLARIAEHLACSVEELLCEDQSALLRVAPDPQALRSVLRTMLPVFCTEQALESEPFRRGLQAHRSLWACFAPGHPDSGQGAALLFDALDAYEDVTEGPGRMEAVANTLSLWCLLHLMLHRAPELLDAESAPLALLRRTDRQLDRDIETELARREESPALDRERQAAVRELDDPEHQRKFFALLRLLKASPRWAYAADYLLALRYLLDMVPNGLGPESNARIGAEMMASFARLGNRLARRIRRAGRELWRPETV
ncbi:MAG: helix-turn-helix domain-containing protein [Oscillospiraceae bacterium]|nr:helix-turn-helix domain-containing protein [Oscillospiraceae bacterium]